MMGNKILVRLHLSVWIILVGLFCQIIMISWPKVAMAETNVSNWSWSATKPDVFSSNKVTDIPSGLCPSSYKLADIAGALDDKKVCVAEGSSVSFGIYFSDFSFRPVVGFSYDGKMYRVNGICGQYDNCLYLPSTDTLITKQYLVNGYVRSLVVYKNFTQRLTRSFNSLNLTTEYDFNASNPDYIFKSAGGYAWPVGGVGASDNGKWLVVEFRQRGIGLLDIETMQMKRVSTMAFSYGTGYDPTSELAVSNDGKYIAIMGSNAGLKVIDASSDCGDEATDDKMSFVTPITNRCKESPIEFTDFIYRFYQATHPKFNDDGGELSFYATSYLGELREVSLRAAGYGGQKLDYLALGDSFSSGEGESDDSYYLNGTNDEFEKCHVSTRSYPFLIASLSKINPDYMRSVACSGATMSDVVGNDYGYWGQGNRLGKDGLNLNPSDRVLSQTEAKASFLQGRTHQETFAIEYQPKVMTLGIGGNDAGFMQKLQACLGPDTCNWATDPEKKEQIAVEIKNLFSTFVNTYQELHDSSPNSKIYAIGYPKMTSEDDRCDLLTGFLLDKTERQFMNEAVVYLNQVIAAAAQKVGIKYLDVQDSYGDHVLCGSMQSTAVNSIRFGDDISLINQSNWFKIIGQESFHANSLGHAYIAETIFASIGNISSYDYCSNGAVVCPTDISVPEPSTYWVPETYHNYPTLKLTDFMLDRAGSTDNRQKQFILPNLSLMPNSSVTIEINSTPQTLGQFQASDDGALDINVDLPIDLEEGYHTVHIYGTSYSGEPVDLYQVIAYRKPVVVQDDQPQQTDGDSPTESDGVDNSASNSDVDYITEIAKPLTIVGATDAQKSDENINVETTVAQSGSVDEGGLNTSKVLGSSVVSDNAPQNSVKNGQSEQPDGAPSYVMVFLICTISLVIALVVIVARIIHKVRV